MEVAANTDFLSSIGSCIKHGMIPADALCGDCAHAYCEECLVRPFGPSKPPLCIGCALRMAGVRGTAAPTRRHREKVTWREKRSRRRLPVMPSVAGDPGGFDFGELDGSYGRAEADAMARRACIPDLKGRSTAA